MTRTLTCKFCASTDIPADLACVPMCEDCVKSSVDILVMDRGWLWTLIVKWFLRRRRRILADMIFEH